MKKFDFLIGTWRLDYLVPQSELSQAMTGRGTGIFRRVLNDKYVFFDYTSTFSNGTTGAAHAVFARDNKTGLYRYWWFEDSGAFLTASCQFINDETLFLSWQDTLLTQTFAKVGPDQVILRMEQPNSQGQRETVLEVLMTRE